MTNFSFSTLEILIHCSLAHIASNKVFVYLFIFFCTKHVFSLDAFKMFSLFLVKQLDYYLPWYSFLHCYTWGSLWIFWICGFLGCTEFGNISVITNANICLFLSLLIFGDSSLTYNVWLEIAVTHFPDILFIIIIIIIFSVSCLCVSFWIVSFAQSSSLLTFSSILFNLLLILSSHFQLWISNLLFF